MLSENKSYLVYWIHLPQHTDPNKEGYVGITCELNERIKHHVKYGNKNVRKYIHENAIVDIIHHDITCEEAIILEEQYRPIEFIGWNVNKGGIMPPSRKNAVVKGKPILKGIDRTPKQKQAAKIQSERLKGRGFKPYKKCSMFNQDFPSVKECRQKLNLSISQYYYGVDNWQKYNTPEDMKQDIWLNRNNKISKARMEPHELS